jgi:hypothetical protein
MFNPPHPLDFPTSPQPPLPPQPPRIALSPSVMHAPPSAWPQHHTLLDAPILNFTLSGPHTLWSSHLSLSLSDTRTHKTTERTTTTCTHARTHADNVSSSSTCTTATSSGRLCSINLFFRAPCLSPMLPRPPPMLLSLNCLQHTLFVCNSPPRAPTSK